MIRPEVLDAMLAAGCSATQITAAVKADVQAEQAAQELKLQAKRAKTAERQRRFKERRSNAGNALPALNNTDNALAPSPNDAQRELSTGEDNQTPTPPPIVPPPSDWPKNAFEQGKTGRHRLPSPRYGTIPAPGAGSPQTITRSRSQP